MAASLLHRFAVAIGALVIAGLSICAQAPAKVQTPGKVQAPVKGKAQTPAPSPPERAGAWLDAPLTNWNATLTQLPHAKIAKDAEPMDPRCDDTHRTGNTPEDKLITSAGWTLFGQEQHLEDVALVTALTSVDGMCRPLGYQAFLFVGGKLAGTISPKPMDSRSDGSTGPLHLTSTSMLTVGFNRYTASDALCCPSKRQIVTYSIDRTGERPMLVPQSVRPLGRESR